MRHVSCQHMIWPRKDQHDPSRTQSTGGERPQGDPYTRTWKSGQSPKQHTNRMGRTAFRKSVQSVQNKAKHHVDATFRSAITYASELFSASENVQNTLWTVKVVWKNHWFEGFHIHNTMWTHTLYESVPGHHKSAVINIGSWGSRAFKQTPLKCSGRSYRMCAFPLRSVRQIEISTPNLTSQLLPTADQIFLHLSHGTTLVSQPAIWQPCHRHTGAFRL